MILVNDPGSWNDIYPQLRHAEWHGWTPTDLVFPFFLFIVGTALAYSLRKYRTGAEISPAVYWRIARRTVVLIALGLFLNRSTSLFNYLLGHADTLDFSNWRFPGVLQRIGLVYLIAALVVLHLGLRAQAVLAGVLLLGYWGLLAWLPSDNYQENLSSGGNVVRVVDLAVLGKSHMYTQATSELTEPEGLLSTLPAVVTALAGYWAGLFIQRRGINVQTVAWLMAAGAVCVLVGLLWNTALPINKKLWTSSYVVLAAGWALVVLAGSLLKFDIWGWRRIGRAFEVVGVNAILVFVASGLSAVLLSVTHVGEISTKQWLYDNLFTSWIENPELASLGYACATVAFWWLAMWLLSLRGWTLRV
jgi:predicted acyltransferase